MKRKSNKQKKPKKNFGSWLQEFCKCLAEIGAFLLGLAELLNVIFQIVTYLSGQ